MIDTLLGIKMETIQRFTQDGKRIPVTRVKAGDFLVVQTKTQEKDGYSSLQLGWGERSKKTTNKALKGHLVASKTEKAPLYLLEVRTQEVANYKPGETIKFSEILHPGDEIKVTGLSKGKGFAGVVKRWGFKGGPKTHGQSDRQRSPGSIGQTTTPGRVYRGKKMAGHMGSDTVTITKLEVVEVDSENNFILVKGLVPGAKSGKLLVTKTGENKKFVPLLALGQKEIQETEEEKAQRLQREKESEEKLKEAVKTENKGGTNA